MTPTPKLLITGIPRAGTTLTTAIVDRHRDAVAISEPGWQGPWSREIPDRGAYVERLVEDFERVRLDILAGGSVPDRRDQHGRLYTNYYRDLAGPHPGRARETRDYSRPGLSPQFLLAMKHNAHYSCVLPDIVRETDFKVLAVVRHPVPTLLSWRSLDLPVSRGHMPAAEPFWPEIAALRCQSDDLLRIQAGIYELFCRRYQAMQEQIHIVKYENLVADPGILEPILGREYLGGVRIDPKPWRQRFERREIEKVSEYVRQYCPGAAAFYQES